MTIHAELPKLETLATLTAGYLRKLAGYVDNERYAACCAQLAHARDAQALGDERLMAAHIERAKKAYADFQSAEEAQIARALERMRANEERSRYAGVFYGQSYATSAAETYANDQFRGHGYRR